MQTLLDSMIEEKNIKLLFQEYRNVLIIQVTSRRLQEESDYEEEIWTVGDWSFEDANQVVGRV